MPTASIQTYNGARIHVREIDGGTVEISGPGAASLHQECNALDLANGPLGDTGAFTLPASEYDLHICARLSNRAEGAAAGR